MVELVLLEELVALKELAILGELEEMVAFGKWNGIIGRIGGFGKIGDDCRIGN